MLKISLTIPEEIGRDIFRHDYHMTTRTYCVVIIACFRVQGTPSTFIKVSPHLDCYSVNTRSSRYLSGGLCCRLNRFLYCSHTRTGTERYGCLNFKRLSLQRPRGSTGFTQYSFSAQSELLKDMYILHALATKTEIRPESFPVHFPIGGRRLTF